MDTHIKNIDPLQSYTLQKLKRETRAQIERAGWDVTSSVLK